ncbi:hypothetical protein L873DRAFT_1786626 [Choiromyces venosus 120613-1]|uniref:Uncharacterized protein n=1 Tax=Choiromyces venosus 120613-1 TaxID=1336337 RepID=A0A3N4K3E1_9PEZI|nr:hypothetical protein L873DRAFT_1786626 [Choiromyces venosus 120613-1]
MPALCEPTYGLLLSLSYSWLRRCQAIGDYARKTYVIKDNDRGNHFVPLKTQVMKIGKIHGPKVVINPEADRVDLGKDLIEDLELDELLLFSEIVKHIAWEIGYKSYSRDSINSKSKVLGATSSDSDYGGDEENEEHIDLGLSVRKLDGLVDKCQSVSKVNGNGLGNFVIEMEAKKKLRFIDLEKASDRVRAKMSEEDGIGIFGEEDEFVYREMGF